MREAGRVERCAPGVKVEVIAANGTRTSLPFVIETTPAVTSIDDVLQQIGCSTTRSIESLAVAMSTVTEQIGQAVASVKEVVSGIATDQQQVAKSFDELAVVLRAPVKPIYDKSGKLVGASRE